MTDSARSDGGGFVIAHSIKEVDLDVRDIAYIVEEVWRNKSAISRASERITLSRWDRSKPTTVWNLITLTVGEAERHDRLATPVGAYPPEVIERIQTRLDAEERLQHVLRMRGFA